MEDFVVFLSLKDMNIFYLSVEQPLKVISFPIEGQG